MLIGRRGACWKEGCLLEGIVLIGRNGAYWKEWCLLAERALIGRKLLLEGRVLSGSSYWKEHIVSELTKSLKYFFQVHRLVVVDENDCIAGVLSLSDLLQVLVLHPPG